MPPLETLTAYLLATFLLAITPGPNMLHVVTSSLRQGRKAGIMSALGSFAGRVVHTLLVAEGLSALLLAVPLAFEVIKIAGAGYLIYLGLKTILSHAAELAAGRPQSLSKVFYQGFVTNLINPKVAIFYLAFLPQFVDAARGSVFWQIILLGFLLNIVSTVVYIFVALLSGTANRWVRQRPLVAKIQNWATGGVFIIFGTTLLFTERKG